MGSGQGKQNRVQSHATGSTAWTANVLANLGDNSADHVREVIEGFRACNPDSDLTEKALSVFVNGDGGTENYGKPAVVEIDLYRLKAIRDMSAALEESRFFDNQVKDRDIRETLVAIEAFVQRQKNKEDRPSVDRLKF